VDDDGLGYSLSHRVRLAQNRADDREAAASRATRATTCGAAGAAAASCTAAASTHTPAGSTT
jgi:hypothetical protein